MDIKLCKELIIDCKKLNQPNLQKDPVSLKLLTLKAMEWSYYNMFSPRHFLDKGYMSDVIYYVLVNNYNSACTSLEKIKSDTEVETRRGL